MSYGLASFPLADNIFSSQPLTLFQTQSLKNLKVPFLELPTSVGIPRYLSFKALIGTSRTYFTTYLIACGHPMVKNIDDFFLFILCPKARQ
jgi:hypothetical protein